MTGGSTADWVPLEEAEDLAVVGGKAAQLGRLIRAGLRVPSGGVVTVGAHRRRLAGQFDEAALATVVGARLAGYQPDSLFAVRSSAEVEDSARASFAGQFRSLLGVQRDDVTAAVRVVQDSVHNPSARVYARRRGVPEPDALAVIVQDHVAARLAGVCFTLDPVTGTDDVLVEYALGVADALVGGAELPAGTVRFQRTAGGLVPVTDDPYQADALLVARLAVSLEPVLRGPQDVEWAHDASTLWLLQARPITATPIAPRADPEE